MAKFSRRTLWGITGTILALLVFIYLATQAVGGLRQVATYELKVNWIFLGLSFLAQLVGVTISILVWRDILSTFGISMPYRSDISIIGLSSLGRKIPGTIWYALGRISLYRRHNQPSKDISLAIVYEIIALSLAGIAAFAIGIAFGTFPQLRPSPRAFLFLGILALFAMMLHFFPKFIQMLANHVIKTTNHEGIVDTPSLSPLVTLRWVLGELLVIFFGSLVAFFLFLAMQPIIDVSLLSLLCVWGLVVALGPLVVLLPVVIGLRDGLVFILLSMIVTQNTAALAILLWRVWVLFLELLVGLGSGLFLALDTQREPVHHD